MNANRCPGGAGSPSYDDDADGDDVDGLGEDDEALGLGGGVDAGLLVVGRVAGGRMVAGRVVGGRVVRDGWTVDSVGASVGPGVAEGVWTMAVGDSLGEVELGSDGNGTSVSADSGAEDEDEGDPAGASPQEREGEDAEGCPASSAETENRAAPELTTSPC
jgi:hypothetical protein